MSGFMQLQVYPAMSVTIGGTRVEEGSACPSCDAYDNTTCECAHEGRKPGWFARYSAPGYLDCTDTVYGSTPDEAACEAFALYGDDTNQDDRRELAAILWQCRAQRRAK